MLKEAGYQVDCINRGDLAVEKAKKYQPDLVLLDLLLSGMDGREVTRRLRNQTETGKIPIIILSAHPNAQDLAKEAGANDFLAKPFDMFDLLKKVEKYTS